MIQINLEGLRILNTRPLFAGAHLRFKDLIESHGGTTYSLPLQELKPLSFDMPQDFLFEKLIFVSQASVEFFLQKAPPISASVEIIAIGEATARALQNKGFKVSHFAKDGTSETLLQSPYFQNIQGQSILCVKGTHGRAFISEELRKKLANVTELNVYESILIPYDPQKINALMPQINMILMTSEQAFNHLKNLCPKALYSHQNIICFSQRLADIAKKSIQGHILICQHHQILETLFQFKAQYADFI